MRRTGALATLGEAPEWGWTYAYAFPADAIRIWSMEDAATIDWGVESNSSGRTIVTNITPIKLLYIAQVEDPSQFTPTFVIALSKWLESMMAINLTGKTTRKDSAFREAQFWIAESTSMNGQQGTPNTPQTNELETVRDSD